MKLKKLKLKNFGAFVDFECEFDGKLTHLVGVNGSGKTTVGLTSIWAGLKGIAERKAGGQLTGERFRFIGNAKASADIELTLHDDFMNETVVIKNHITKATNSITFEASENHHISPNWLNNLLSVAFLSAKNFTALEGREQALLLGIDTSGHDEVIKILKEDATVLGRQLKAYGDIPVVMKVEAVSVTELISERDAVFVHNDIQRVRDGKIFDMDQAVDLTADLLKTAKEEVVRFAHKLSCEEQELKELIPPEERMSANEINDKLINAEAINRQASAYEANQTKLKERKAVADSLEHNKVAVSKAVKKRLAYIKEHDFGFDGLEVDENGRLLLSDRPLREPYFSKGELELIVSKLYMSLDPELKIRFIDDFELLDEDNQVKIVDALLAEGFQVITAEVGKVATKENTILLRECAIANSYEDKPENKLV